jgi:hypothetical protein
MVDMPTITQQLPQSPFRFPGGKARVASYLCSYKPLDAIELREAFVGGGSFSIENGFAFDRVWINDLNAGLVAVYQALRDRPEQFIAACRQIAPACAGDPMTPRGSRGGAPKNARLSAVFDAIKLNDACDQALRYFFLNRTVHSCRVDYSRPKRMYFSNPAGWNITCGDALEQVAATLRGWRITDGLLQRAESSRSAGKFLLKAICSELQRRADHGIWYLSCRTAADLITSLGYKVDYSNVSRWLNAFVAEGFLVKPWEHVPGSGMAQRFQTAAVAARCEELDRQRKQRQIPALVFAAAHRVARFKLPLVQQTRSTVHPRIRGECGLRPR